MADLEWWQTLVSGGIGGLLAIGGQAALSAAQHRMSRQLASEQRSLDFADDRRQFELQRLAELRVALLAILRTLRGVSGPSVSVALLDDARSHLGVTLDGRVRELGLAAIEAVGNADWDELGSSSYVSAHKETARCLDAIDDRIRALYGDATTK